MRRSLTWILAGLVVLAFGCSKAPTDKVAAAEKAVEEASAAGAADYLAEDFTKLTEMLASAKKEIADQDSKMAFLRDYQKAEQLLASVEADAERLKSDAVKQKEQMKAVALQAQKDAQGAVTAAKGLLAKAPVGKDRAAVESIRADLDGLDKSLPEVQTALDTGDYKAATAKAKAIQDKSQGVSAELEAAIAKVSQAQGQAAKAKSGKPKKKK